MGDSARVLGQRSRPVYRSHRIIDVLRKQGRTGTWFCRQVPCDYSLLYKTRDGDRAVQEWFAIRASEILGMPMDALFIDPITDGDDHAAA